MEVQDIGHWEGAKQGGKMWKCRTLDTGRGPSKGVRCGSARHWTGAKQGGKMWKCGEGAKQGVKRWKCKTLDTARRPSSG